MQSIKIGSDSWVEVAKSWKTMKLLGPPWNSSGLSGVKEVYFDSHTRTGQARIPASP